MNSDRTPVLALKEVDEDVKAFRLALEARDFKAAATHLLTGARNIAYRLLEGEGFEFPQRHVHQSEFGPALVVFNSSFEELDQMAKFCDALVMRDGTELPAVVTIAGDLFRDLRVVQGTLDGRNPDAVDEPTHMAIIIANVFSISQNYTLAQMWENTFWEQFGKAKKAQIDQANARRKGGGHNRKWAEVARPYMDAEPNATRSRIADLILLDPKYADADKSAILRALKPQFSKR
ncbi:hypothetical protein [Asticcacaulis excentricus]|uniref:hypothetical protein n=1 Tax=Asticcacaulis excentricus TaxID=78587 RepID=UPI000F81FFE1|nr:hypothetical protein [Asticcacaulis excentricus]